MPFLELNRNPSAKDLKAFGLVLGILLLAGASTGFLKGASVPLIACAVAASLSVALAAFAWPRSLRLLYIIWTHAVFPIGWTVSLLLLLIVFFGVITPYGLIARALGYDPMEASWGAHSYWRRRAPRSAGRESYFRPF